MAAKFPGVTPLGGGRYRVRVRYVEDGKRRERDRYVEARNAQEAFAMRDHVMTGLARFPPIASDQSAAATPLIGSLSVTIKQAADQWLAQKRVRKVTRLKYQDGMRRIVPALGDVYIDRLTPGMVRAFVNAVYDEHSWYTARDALAVLKQITKYAQAEYALPRWSCEGVKPPARKNAAAASLHIDADATADAIGTLDRNALTAEELARLWAAMQETQPRLFPLFLTMALTGTRFAEASALRWMDIGFKSGQILIRQSHAAGEVNAPKTAAGLRRFPLDRDLAIVLSAHREALKRSKVPHAGDAICFPSDVGTFLHRKRLSVAIREALTVAGIGHRFTGHGLRATMNKLLNEVTSGEMTRALIGHAEGKAGQDMTVRYTKTRLAEERVVFGRALAPVRKALQRAQRKGGSKGGSRQLQR